MALSKTGHNIKKRQNANDIFITPLPLAKFQIDMIHTTPEEVWYDPFRNNGSYYNQFPEGNPKEWSEILDGRDFFEFDKHVDVICSNPPYSLMNRVIEKCIELKPRVVSLLVGMMNFNPKRIEMFEKAGYRLTRFHLTDIYKWFGRSYIIQFELSTVDAGAGVKFTYDRKSWR
jgi:hypothetical protein